MKRRYEIQIKISATVDILDRWVVFDSFRCDNHVEASIPFTLTKRRFPGYCFRLVALLEEEIV